MPPPSLARQFFDSIVQAADPVAAIRSLFNTSSPTFETDWLDFKTEHTDPKQRDRHVKETWSQALGGFANNQGGVLLWGIDARKTKVGAAEIDAAIGEKPMTDPQALKSRLAELQRGATDPPLANVEVVAYDLPTQAGKGFVVCYVPEGPFKPYRSELADRQWCIRAGDNFVVMSPAVLRAMFYPRTWAVFSGRVDLSLPPTRTTGPGGVNLTKLDFAFHLTNKGTATAKDTLVQVSFSLPGRLRHAQAGKLWRDLLTGDDLSYSAVLSLHPRITTEVCSGQWELSGSGTIQGSPASLVAEVSCENQEPQLLRATFSMAELTMKQKMTVQAAPHEEV
jgi:hypothetical protein